ncbi:MAG: 50S ribosomal protein L25 [Spirochaetaceae bacterium]|jgi:large subunit ribosomal protein L25|nr:50S ribosomal protein L25 [Spirochaetaceae bacterium]
MGQVVFSAQDRANRGSAEAKRLRRAGRIPAVIYGRKGASVAIDLDAREFMSGVKGISESTIVKVAINGKVHDAFVKDTQRDIKDGNILHVDFYEIEGDTLLRARVSLNLQGNPIGVREGGILETPLHDIEVECFPKDLPERLDVDIAGLKANQAIHVRDLALGSGVKLISNPDQVVALVKFAKAEAAPAAAEEAAAAAAPAAGAAAPAAEKKAEK